MHLISSKLWIFALAVLLPFAACNKDENDDMHDDHDHDHEHAEATVTWNSPTSDSLTLTDAANVLLSINVTSEEELHEVELSLLDSASQVVAPFPIEGHDHSKSIDLSQTVDLSAYPSGARFTAQVKICESHDCTEFEKETRDFFLP